jgi:type 1 fimbria pilin
MLGGGVALAQSTGNATITVTGSIDGGSCAISTQPVDLGAHDPSEFTGVTTPTQWVDFSITSEGCTPDIAALHMGFNGDQDSDNKDLFAVAPGGATGLGIQLQGKDAANTFVIPNSTTQLVTWTPLPANGSYAMQARYVQTRSQVTAGDANATVTVVLSYN